VCLVKAKLLHSVVSSFALLTGRRGIGLCLRIEQCFIAVSLVIWVLAP
jgi:hypothetical protein